MTRPDDTGELPRLSQGSHRSQDSHRSQSSHIVRTGNVLPSTTLLDAQLPGPHGAELASCPSYWIGELALYPRPTIHHTDDGQPVAVVLDLRRWLISHPGGHCVPIECTSIQAATVAADQFARDEQAARVVGTDPDSLQQWARWWADQHPDTALLDSSAPAGGGW